jgi:hypothetical protein
VRRALLLGGVLLVTACGNGHGDAPAAAGDDAAAAPTAGQAGAAEAAWPADPGAGVNLRREASWQLTGEAAPDQLIVTAQGSGYAALEIRLVIRDASGDTLWADGWSSSAYLEHAGADRLIQEELRGHVQAQVDSLLHPSRFTASGLPRLERDGVPRGRIRESVAYHLAELDWRNRSSLRPADRTPGSAFDRISAAEVAPARVEVVTNEVLAGPTFRYHAGGAVNYVIGWSVREHAFVRVYSCC